MSRIVKEEEYAVRRNEILDVARRLVYTKGYEQMTIQDILDQLQISKGAFYHYFASKQDLLEGLNQRMVDEVVQVIQPIVEEPGLPAIEKLERYFATAARWKTTQKEYLLAMLRVWYADGNAVVRQKIFAASIKQVGPMITRIIQQGVQEGVFHPAYPDLVGDVIMALWLSSSDALVEQFLTPETHPGGYQRVVKFIAAYTDAMERILGVPPGSLHLVDPAVIEVWFTPIGELLI